MRGFANVEGFVGYWGSGKSLLLCRSILNRLDADPCTLVGNNFGFTGPNAVECNSIEDYVAFACMDTPGYRKILAIDEVGGLARARGHAVFPPAADVVFQQGRKLGLSVLWSTQHWRLLDVNIRRVTEKVSECHGLLYKRLTPRGELPERWRPRLIKQRVFYAPDPERSDLPKQSDFTAFRPFDQVAADSYDTMKLVKNFQLLMQQQQEQQPPFFDVVVELMRDGNSSG